MCGGGAGAVSREIVEMSSIDDAVNELSSSYARYCFSVSFWTGMDDERLCTLGRFDGVRKCRGASSSSSKSFSSFFEPGIQTLNPEEWIGIDCDLLE